jgi:hypothetical protein
MKYDKRRLDRSSLYGACEGCPSCGSPQSLTYVARRDYYVKDGLKRTYSCDCGFRFRVCWTHDCDKNPVEVL